MKIRTKLDPDKCCVPRCSEPLYESHTRPDGSRLWWCKVHGHEACKEAGAAKIEIEVDSLEFPPEEEQVPSKALAVVKPAEDLGVGQLILSPAQHEELLRVHADAERDLAELQEITISAPDEVQFAEGERRKARDAAKRWDALRKSAGDYWREGLKRVDGTIKPAVDVLKALDTGWSKAIETYRVKVEEERRELLEAARLEQVAHAAELARAEAEQARAERLAQEALAAQEAGENEHAEILAEEALAAQAAAQATVQAAAQRPAAVREALVLAACTEAGTADTYVDNWKFEVVDADSVPKEYLSPDPAKIGAVVKSLRDACQIPGVRVYNEPFARSKR